MMQMKSVYDNAGWTNLISGLIHDSESISTGRIPTIIGATNLNTGNLDYFN